MRTTARCQRSDSVHQTLVPSSRLMVGLEFEYANDRSLA
jgi:hypothetical protein